MGHGWRHQFLAGWLAIFHRINPVKSKSFQNKNCILIGLSSTITYTHTTITTQPLPIPIPIQYQDVINILSSPLQHQTRIPSMPRPRILHAHRPNIPNKSPRTLDIYRRKKLESILQSNGHHPLPPLGIANTECEILLFHPLVLFRHVSPGSDIVFETHRACFES